MHPLVQHVAWPAAPVHAPWVQGVVDDWKSHPSGSAEHVASVDLLAHAGPATPHTGSSLHVHLAEPLAPVQLWCAAQATGVPKA